jgi:hypothetical protein
MTRADFEHVVKAAADVVKDELVVVGSQSILGQFADAPASLLRSQEIDVYPLSDPERAQVIDGAIGDGSTFHATYGYYAHGVGPETIAAPAGWQGRLTRLELPAIRKRDGTVVAWCLEVHDLVLAKLAAGRPHDYEFVDDALRAGLVDLEQLRLGLDLMPGHDGERVRERLDGAVARTRVTPTAPPSA